MLQYYAYRFAIRPVSNLLQFCGKLFHQFIVDAYTKIEANRLKYIREHQKELRSDLYQGLMDYVNEQKDGLFGKITVLPSSFKVN